MVEKQGQRITNREAMVRNLKNLVKHHKEHCDGSCTVSLNMVKMTIEELGGTIFPEEEQYFI